MAILGLRIQDLGLRAQSSILDRLDARHLGSEDRLPERLDGLYAGEALPPCQYHTAVRCGPREGDVGEQIAGAGLLRYRRGRQYGEPQTRGDHQPDRLERRALDRLLDRPRRGARAVERRA